MTFSKSCFFIGPSWLLLAIFSASWIQRASANICRHPSLAFATQSSSPSPTQESQTEHSSGRRWKNRRKRQTFLPSPVRQVTSRDEAALLDQLGYVPPNICKVSARSGRFDNNNSDVDEIDIAAAIDTSCIGRGRPIAIQSYPLIVQRSKEDGGKNNQTPFPTMYWLTDPHVSRAISELERNGYVRQFQSRLEDDTSLAKEWWQCHEEYALERWELLSDPDKEWLLISTDQIDGEKNPEQRKVESMREMIQHSGVAGTDHKRLRETDHDDKSKDATVYVPSVKCLHSHYAHYRSQNKSENAIINVVGKWTHELLMEEFPDLVI